MTPFTISKTLNSRPRRRLVAALAAMVCAFGGLSSGQGKDEMQKGDLVAICGDSITEQRLYSIYMEEYLLMCQPKPDLQAMQFGWSGETAYLFRQRQKNDCLVFKPTVATICYGMNDAGYVATDQNRLEPYGRHLTGVVENFKEAGVRFIVLGAPGVVDSDTFKRKQVDSGTYNAALGDFGATAERIAAKEGVAFADVHGIMMDAMAKAKAKYGKGYQFAGDGVHPGPNGHLVMAYAFLKALGCSGEIGTINVDLKGNSATATDGHKILSVSNGNVEVESTRYPFCFYGDPKEQTTRSMIDFIPFNDDLNRFSLVVKNATAPKLKVTWGANSRAFTAAELEKGINLAAEFLDNPFSEPFATVEKAIKEQQVFDTTATKSLLHSLLLWRQLLPDQLEAYGKMEQAAVEKDRVLRVQSRAAIVPVTHTIKIEPAA